MHSITERLIENNNGKDKELINERYKQMDDDAFAFCRGTCGIFYKDLCDELFGSLPDSPIAWISGDLHVANFGTYRSKDGLVRFDLNDFDEATPAPVLWEVSRLVTSIIVLCNCQKMDANLVASFADACLRAYIAALTSGGIANEKPQEVPIRDLIKKACKEDLIDLLKAETKQKDDRRKFDMQGKQGKDKRRLDKKTETALLTAMSAWMHGQSALHLKDYTVLDAVFRIAGTGSIGLNRYMLLLHKKGGNADACLIIEIKEAESPAVPSPLQKHHWTSEAGRIVLAQQRMQAVPPELLAEWDFNKKTYVVRELQPQKKKVKFDKGKDKADKDAKLTEEEFREIFTCMGRLTAQAQLRSAGMDGTASENDLIAFGKRGNEWAAPLMEYAQQCAATTSEYFEAFEESRQKGSL